MNARTPASPISTRWDEAFTGNDVGKHPSCFDGEPYVGKGLTASPILIWPLP